MVEHLYPDQLERLSNYQLKGAELLTALDHLEECEGCRQKVKSPTKLELLNIVFGDESPADDKTSIEPVSEEFED